MIFVPIVAAGVLFLVGFILVVRQCLFVAAADYPDPPSKEESLAMKLALEELAEIDWDAGLLIEMPPHLKLRIKEDLRQHKIVMTQNEYEQQMVTLTRMGIDATTVYGATGEGARVFLLDAER